LDAEAFRNYFNRNPTADPKFDTAGILSVEVQSPVFALSLQG